MSSVSDEDVQKVIDNLIRRYGDNIPNPDHYPRIFKTLIKHELFYINRDRNNNLKEDK